ncbi:histone H3 methyltransferase SUV39H1/Clr4 [Penicillium lagena]|uniref:histone H3 methyltransferase SUV39H1/Clr4 n=1 Tax=Penicillium lagena TaxID=94218 RepID=UPI0025402340|nr:histone H3 methyltransferase SUV39H1/Clr4 [Penicillium lagena]KAJ5620031.1 histone H3 methyltransferase SUV39H1/Clr4 [Penicillium lagena]
MAPASRGWRPSRSYQAIVDLTAEDDQENRMFPAKIAHFITTIPQKRKTTEGDRSPIPRALSSQAALNAGIGNKSRDQSADQSSRQSSRRPDLSTDSISVVIPRPSPNLQRQIEATEQALSLPLGVATNFVEVFTPNHFEKMAGYRKYSLSRPSISHSETPLAIGSSPMPAGKQTLLCTTVNSANETRKTLQFKLNCIQGPPVSYDVNDPKILRRLASDFDFINEYKLHKEVEPTPQEFLYGCSCDPICSDKCACLYKDEDTSETIIPYSNEGLLTSDFLERKVMISECSSQCECSSSSSDEKCWNHVVQEGRTINLVIFHTGPRGFGLRSPSPIRKGQFIDRYLGEVISKEKASIREDGSEKDQSYLFSLDWSGECKYVVDAQKFGTITRFMNHSCNPNCKLIPVSTEQGDNHFLYDLAFFALRDIPADTELTFDYNPDAEMVETIDPDAVKCLCGEENCRKQLWPNKRKGTK